MDSGILDKINLIKTLIDVDFTVIDRNDADNFEGVFAYFRENPDEKFYQDSGMTYFSFSYKGVTEAGFICGVTEVEKNYALLLSALIENVLNPYTDVTEEDKIKRVLAGEYNERRVVSFMRSAGIDDGQCVALAIRTKFKSNVDIHEYIGKNFITSGDRLVLIDETTCALIKFVGKDCSYGKVCQFAQDMKNAIYSDLGVDVLVGIGAFVSGFIYIDKSYEQALDAVSIGVNYDGSRGVYPYHDYLIHKILQSIPKDKLEDYYFGLLSEEGIALLNDADMENTANVFFESDLNISDASRRLYMHRNTLMYRIDKIEKSTNLNVNSFSDALTFKLLTIISKILTK